MKIFSSVMTHLVVPEDSYSGSLQRMLLRGSEQGWREAAQPASGGAFSGALA